MFATFFFHEFTLLFQLSPPRHRALQRSRESTASLCFMFRRFLSNCSICSNCVIPLSFSPQCRSDRFGRLRRFERLEDAGFSSGSRKLRGYFSIVNCYSYSIAQSNQPDRLYERKRRHAGSVTHAAGRHRSPRARPAEPYERTVHIRFHYQMRGKERGRIRQRGKLEGGEE
jgi:hypothetical protein